MPTGDVAIVTPWYPTLDQPFRGAFVRAAVRATSAAGPRVIVYHCDDWAHSLPPGLSVEAARAHADLLPLAVSSRPRDVGGARLAYLPVPFRSGAGYAEVAGRHAAVLSAALAGRPIEADVVHAHVGLPSGWAALSCAAPRARIFVTEHASFLPRVLAQPRARAMYDQLLHRCTGFFAVGERVRRPLAEAFPHHADRITIRPDPVSFDATRPDPVQRLRRWLYVGALSPAKGVVRLLDAFAICHAEEPELTLTVVGDGELRGRLGERAVELGVAGAVTFTGPVPPDRAARLMREHDLLVHASRAETFGMTVVEAVAAGLPVLVTRSGGPQESLAGVEADAAEFVDVADDAQSLAEGYRRLRARLPGRLDLPRARRVLAARYSDEAYARACLGAWFPHPPPGAAEPGHDG